MRGCEETFEFQSESGSGSDGGPGCGLGPSPGGFGPQKVVQTILTPLRAGATGLTRQAQKLYSYIFRYEALETENQELRARIAELEDDARTADSLQRENERLRELAELKKEKEDYQLASAYIITWDSNDWTSSFTINKGSGSGIAEDMVAITAQGEVVGLVTAVGSNWATVTTVLDSALEVSANIASSGYARYGAGRLHHWRGGNAPDGLPAHRCCDPEQ